MARMRPRVTVLIAAVVILAGVGAWALLSGSDSDKSATGPVGERVEAQLAYMDPASSAVVAVDMRYGEENWSHVRRVGSRLLRELRAAGDSDVTELPPNLSGALSTLAGFAGLSFEKDVEPLMDGYLAVGVTLPPRRPLPEKLARLDDLLSRGAFYSADEGGYVLPSPPGEQPASGTPRPGRLPLARESDGSRVTEEEGARFHAAERRRDAAADPRVVVTYRTPGGGLERVMRKALEGDPPKKLDGYDDVQLLEESIALVGDNTLVAAFGGDGGRPSEGASPPLLRALRREQADRGYPAARLASAQRRGASRDPFIVAAGDLTLARATVEEPNLRRARREVPYLAAVRGIGAVVDLNSERATGRLRVSTDRGRLKRSDLPLAEAGGLELPATDLVGGGSRNQSVTTTFAARVARALFADSRFIRAVDRAERDLRIGFEEEVLRQFNCPSISVFDTRDQRFGARSCVSDPARMRRLLPRLAPHLPRILTALQGLGDEGLLALLLVAPDAPAVPSLPLGAIRVKPPPARRPQRETIYEITGLRDDANSPLARSGPEQMVFGMIGERFVVASNRQLARRVAALPARRHDGRAATATRIGGRQLVAATEGDSEGAAVARVLEELVLEVSADRSALTARGRLNFGG